MGRHGRRSARHGVPRATLAGRDQVVPGRCSVAGAVKRFKFLPPTLRADWLAASARGQAPPCEGHTLSRHVCVRCASRLRAAGAGHDQRWSRVAKRAVAILLTSIADILRRPGVGPEPRSPRNLIEPPSLSPSSPARACSSLSLSSRSFELRAAALLALALALAHLAALPSGFAVPELSLVRPVASLRARIWVLRLVRGRTSENGRGRPHPAVTGPLRRRPPSSSRGLLSPVRLAED